MPREQPPPKCARIVTYCDTTELENVKTDINERRFDLAVQGYTVAQQEADEQIAEWRATCAQLEQQILIEAEATEKAELRKLKVDIEKRKAELRAQGVSEGQLGSDEQISKWTSLYRAGCKEKWRDSLRRR